jgi:RimJ/RimL family protein N-acetyltransferase
MSLRLTRLDPEGVDRGALIEFLTTDVFPHHTQARPTVEAVETRIASGAYRDDDNDTYWIEHPENGRIGVLQYEDLDDGAPLFDLRLGSRFRGRGYGAQALRATTDHLFSTMPHVTRFEGQTREDNLAMRRIFVSCGWVKEAHYREAWPVEGGDPVASVGYGILRRDWETGRVTPVDWDDLPADSRHSGA